MDRNAMFLSLLLFWQVAAAADRGVFVATGDMTTARAWHTATLLPDGRVLIVGGDSFTTSDGTSTAELYDPATRTFAATGSMSVSRRGHTATLLRDGKVLITGGSQSSIAELYDPATGTFAQTGSPLEVDQVGRSATLLRDGKVLFTGGERAELYDPATGTFSFAGNYAGGPIWPTANTLPDGRVLLSGENPPEIYDPVADRFALTGSMIEPDYQHGVEWQAATTLQDGSVLITGGNDDMTCGGFTSAELYDPSSGSFRVVGPMRSARDIHTATLLRDGTVLIAGGGDGWCGSMTHATAELYVPATQSFVDAATMTHSRTQHTATLLDDGSVLITGGMSYWPATTLRSAEIYRPVPPARVRSVRH